MRVRMIYRSTDGTPSNFHLYLNHVISNLLFNYDYLQGLIVNGEKDLRARKLRSRLGPRAAAG